MKKNIFDTLKIKDFRFFIFTRLFGTLGMQMFAVVVGWQVYEITKDPFSLGLIGLTEAIPSILTALIAGHIVDISERKKILIFSYSLMFICSLILTVISTDSINILAGNNKLIAIYGVVFISGVARGFSMPAAFALLGQIIPREKYSNAITWSTTTWQMGAITGPAIGGLVYGFAGVTTSYLCITILVLASLFCIMAISKKPVPEITESGSMKTRLTAGIKFVFENKIILGVISLDMFAVLFGGAVAMLPVFAKDVLMSGAEGLGILRASPSIGAVLMSLYLTQNPPTKNAGRNLLVCVAGFGLSIILFAVSKSFILSISALILSGMFDSVSVVIRQTIIQLKTPDNMKGRVSAVNSIFIGSSNEIGAFESGLAAKLMDLIPSVIFGGIMTLIVVLVITFTSPQIRKLKL
jgi:MFS family permease